MGLQFLRVGIPQSVISDIDAPMISLGGRTVPDGALGILSAFYDGSCWLPQCTEVKRAPLIHFQKIFFQKGFTVGF